MSEPLRIEFVGAGKQAQAAHLRHFAALEECRVVAIADADRAFLALLREVATPPGNAEQARECLGFVRPWTLWPGHPCPFAATLPVEPAAW